MQRTVRTIVVILAVLGTGLQLSRSQAQQEAGILNKAIQATGGLAKLTKLQGYTFKAKGIYHLDNMKLPFTAQWHIQGANKSRNLIEIDAQGGKSQDLYVLNGDMGWSKSGNFPTRSLDKGDLIEEKENAYLNWISTLAPIKGRGFKLTAVPEVKVDGRAAVGLTVSSPGHRDVKLYFDKATGLLVKTERKVRDTSVNREVLEEMVLSNYKEVDGIKIAMKLVVQWDGRPHGDLEITEAKVQEKLDEMLFAKP